MDVLGATWYKSIVLLARLHSCRRSKGLRYVRVDGKIPDLMRVDILKSVFADMFVSLDVCDFFCLQRGATRGTD